MGLEACPLGFWPQGTPRAQRRKRERPGSSQPARTLQRHWEEKLHGFEPKRRRKNRVTKDPSDDQEERRASPSASSPLGEVANAATSWFSPNTFRFWTSDSRRARPAAKAPLQTLACRNRLATGQIEGKDVSDSPPSAGRPSLAVLFGQPDHLSTSFQTTQLAKALRAHADVTEIRVSASRTGGWRRLARRFYANQIRPLWTQPGTEFVLYANDGCADLRRWKGCRLVYWYDAPSDWARNPPERWIDRLRCRNVVVAEHVFAVSATQVDLGHRLRPGREAGVHYLPVGVDCATFDPAKARPERVREKYRLPAGPIVGYLGYLASWEGKFAGQPLAQVAARVAARSSAHFLIVGFGPALETFQARVAAEGLAGRFTFTGYVPDDWLPDCLAAMDICIDTLEPGFHSEARSETKLKQYMAMGRACVGTDIGENRTDLDQGRCGVLAPPGDEGLLEGILALTGDVERRTALGEAARRRAEEIYHWPKLAERLAIAAGMTGTHGRRP